MGVAADWTTPRVRKRYTDYGNYRRERVREVTGREREGDRNSFTIRYYFRNGDLSTNKKSNKHRFAIGFTE